MRLNRQPLFGRAREKGVCLHAGLPGDMPGKGTPAAPRDSHTSSLLQRVPILTSWTRRVPGTWCGPRGFVCGQQGPLPWGPLTVHCPISVPSKSGHPKGLSHPLWTSGGWQDCGSSPHIWATQWLVWGKQEFLVSRRGEAEGKGWACPHHCRSRAGGAGPRAMAESEPCRGGWSGHSAGSQCGPRAMEPWQQASGCRRMGQEAEREGADLH